MQQRHDLYAHTRYHLANKFGEPEPRDTKIRRARLEAEQSPKGGASLAETGIINPDEDEEIPDILTGEVWRAKQNKGKPG